VVIADAGAADQAKEDAEVHQREQADAADAADYARGHELATDALDDLHQAEDRGRAGDTDTEIIEAERDVRMLDQAEFDQEVAGDNAIAAADYAASGELDATEIYEAEADDAAADAEDAADAGDQDDVDVDDVTSSSVD
jgi:hypothetical protein